MVICKYYISGIELPTLSHLYIICEDMSGSRATSPPPPPSSGTSAAALPKQNHPNSRCQLARGTMGLGAYLRAPTPRDSRSVPSDRAKCHSDRAVRPLRFSRRRPRRADHHRHPRAVGWRGAVRAWLQAQCMGFYGSQLAHVSASPCRYVLIRFRRGRINTGLDSERAEKRLALL